MRVDALMFCLSAQNYEDGTIDIDGVGNDSFAVEAFPSETTVVLYVRIAGQPDDVAHDLLVEVRGSDLEVQAEAGFPMTLNARAPELPDGWEVRAHVAFGLTLAVTKPDVFMVTASIDGGGSESIPLFIRRQ